MAETVVSRDFSSFIKHVVKISKNYEKVLRALRKPDIYWQIMGLQ